MKRALGVLCLAGAGYFLFPAAWGIFHIGMVWPAAVLLYCAAWLLLPGKMGRLPRWLRRLGNGVLAAGLTLAAVLAVLMAAAALRVPPADEPCTVIVAGCQVYDGRPSVMLRRRIDAAYGYLAAHPEAACVCSGGMDDAETVTEADCIADTLTAMGIDPRRLYREDKSTSTAENMAFSAAVIAENRLPRQVVIATDGFHQYRCAAYAKQNGLAPWAASCPSPWYLGPGYWCREMAGILAMWLF